MGRDGWFSPPCLISSAHFQPRTAWNFWLGENMTRLMEQQRREKNSESTTQGTIFRLGGEEWARVADKSRWEEMARLDRERLRTATALEPPPLREGGRGEGVAEEDETI